MANAKIISMPSIPIVAGRDQCPNTPKLMLVISYTFFFPLYKSYRDGGHYRDPFFTFASNHARRTLYSDRPRLFRVFVALANEIP